MLCLHVLTFCFTLSVNRKWVGSEADTGRKWLTFHLQFRRDMFIGTKVYF